MWVQATNDLGQTSILNDKYIKLIKKVNGGSIHLVDTKFTANIHLSLGEK